MRNFFLIISLISLIHGRLDEATPNRLAHKAWQCVYVKGIVWKGPDVWVVWINDQVYTPRTRRGRIVVKNITPRTVTVIYQGGQVFTIPVGYSYDLWRRVLIIGDGRL